MKLNKTLVAAALAAAVVAPAAQADVTLSGSFRGYVATPIDSDNDDADLKIGSSKARINIKGSEAISDSTKVIAELEVDYDDNANASGNGDIEVRTAKVTVVGGFGAFVLAGRTASGQYNDLVGPMYIFEYGGAAFFEQALRTPTVAAYVTPTFAGGLSLVGAVVATGTDNGEDADALAFRARYKTDMFNAAVGIVDYPSDEQRVGLGATANVGPAALGLSYESTTDDPTFGDKDVAGLTVSSDFGNGFGGALGFNTVLSSDAGDEDAQAVQALVTKSLSDNVYVWGEYDFYNDEAASDDALAVGLNISF